MLFKPAEILRLIHHQLLSDDIQVCKIKASPLVTAKQHCLGVHGQGNDSPWPKSKDYLKP